MYTESPTTAEIELKCEAGIVPVGSSRGALHVDGRRAEAIREGWESGLPATMARRPECAAGGAPLASPGRRGHFGCDSHRAGGIFRGADRVPAGDDA